MVRTLDLQSRGHEFDSRLGHCHVVTAWMGNCLRAGKPSPYITINQHQFSTQPFIPPG